MLKFLGHAGFMYETDKQLLLMDPWMSKSGAFDSSWYQFPSNHEFGDEIRNIIEKSNKFFELHSILAPKSSTTLIPFLLGHNADNAGLSISWIILRFNFAITSKAPVLPEIGRAHV